MLEISNLRFRYHASGTMSLDQLSMTIEPGMFLAVVGESGSGKSTFLRTLNGLAPHFHGGEFGGKVVVDGQDTRYASTADLSRNIGYVSQEPEAQTIFENVADEIAFGPENLGFTCREIRDRVHHSMRTVGIEHLRNREISTLSGGERQRVVIAATLSMGSRLLALDEPFSQLDPWASEDLVETLRRLNKEFDVTIIIAEHRIDRLLRHCTHVLELHPESSAPKPEPARAAVPRLRLAPEFPGQGEPVSRGGPHLSIPESLILHTAQVRFHKSQVRPARDSDPAAIRLENASVRIRDAQILDSISLRIPVGSVIAVIGANGSGKTTLLRAIGGLQRLSDGEITLRGENLASIPERLRAESIGYVPQYPSALFLGQSVLDEVRISLQGRDSNQYALALLRQFRLDHLSHRYSYDISGGERQRLALAISIARDPSLLLLDEPTRGMDRRSRADLQHLISEQQGAGMTIVLSTHDMELVASCADEVILLDSGRVRYSGDPEEFLSDFPKLDRFSQKSSVQ